MKCSVRGMDSIIECGIYLYAFRAWTPLSGLVIHFCFRQNYN